jgi:hypothetical protein
LVETENENPDFIVSTIGNYHPPSEQGIDTIGNNRYYETMCFDAKNYKDYIDANVKKQIYFTSKWCINAESPDKLPDGVDNIADDMHEAVLKELMDRYK